MGRVIGDVIESFSKHPKDVERRKERNKTKGNKTNRRDSKANSSSPMGT